MNAYEQMRDRIVKILWCCQWMYDNTGDESVKSHLMEPIRIAKEALAIPRRQCDVGTEKEQWERFDDLCECWQESGPIGGCSSSCPCLDSKYKECDGYVGRSGCFAFWAQTPYAAEEGEGK